MTREEALYFLNKHQPLPDDGDMDEDVISKYDEVRKWFIQHPDPRCIPLFLNSFGNGSGNGVYQLVEDVMAKHDASDVILNLRVALSSNRSSIRYWTAQIAASFPDEAFVQPLSSLLDDASQDIRYVAITALEAIGGDRVRELLLDALEKENDQDICDLLQEVLEEL